MEHMVFLLLVSLVTLFVNKYHILQYIFFYMRRYTYICVRACVYAHIYIYIYTHYCRGCAAIKFSLALSLCAEPAISLLPQLLFFWVCLMDQPIDRLGSPIHELSSS